MDIENYKEYIFILEKHKPSSTKETENLDDDLPF